MICMWSWSGIAILPAGSETLLVPRVCDYHHITYYYDYLAPTSGETMTEQPSFDVDSVVREEEEDHDLLTYNESSARLAVAIGTAKDALETASGEERTMLERRLQQ